MTLSAKKAAQPGASDKNEQQEEEAAPQVATVHQMQFAEASLPSFVPSDTEWLTHPLTSSLYPLQTPGVQRMFVQAHRAVKNNISGRYFTAFHGDGVTEMLQALREMLEASFDGLETIYYPLCPDNSDNPRRVYISLWSILTGAYMPGYAEDTKERVILRFEELALNSRSRTVVLLLDGLEYLTEDEIRFFHGLRHRLQDLRKGLKLIMIGGGHVPDMNKVSNRVKKGKIPEAMWKEVIGVEMPFAGVGSMGDIREIFVSIDQQEHEGVSWPAYFMKLPDGRHFVLADEVDNFEAAFAIVSKGTQKNLLTIGLPLRALLGTVRLFFDFATQVEPETLHSSEIRQHCWKEAMQWVYLVDAVNGKGDAGIVNGLA